MQCVTHNKRNVNENGIAVSLLAYQSGNSLCWQGKQPSETLQGNLAILNK